MRASPDTSAKDWFTSCQDQHIHQLHVVIHELQLQLAEKDRRIKVLMEGNGKLYARLESLRHPLSAKVAQADDSTEEEDEGNPAKKICRNLLSDFNSE